MKTLILVLLTVLSCLFGFLFYQSTIENAVLKDNNVSLANQNTLLRGNNITLVSNNTLLRQDADDKNTRIQKLKNQLEIANNDLSLANTEKDILRQRIRQLELDNIEKDSLHAIHFRQQQEKFQVILQDEQGKNLIKIRQLKTKQQRELNKKDSIWKKRVKDMYYSFPALELSFLGRKPNTKPTKMDSSESRRKVSAKLPQNYVDMVIDITIAIVLVTILTAALQGIFSRRRRF